MKVSQSVNMLLVLAEVKVLITVYVQRKIGTGGKDTNTKTEAAQPPAERAQHVKLFICLESRTELFTDNTARGAILS